LFLGSPRKVLLMNL